MGSGVCVCKPICLWFVVCPGIGGGSNFTPMPEKPQTCFFLVSPVIHIQIHGIVWGSAKKGTSGHGSRVAVVSPRDHSNDNNDRIAEGTRTNARGAEDRNARTWTNTEGRCRRVARGKTRTRGPLCGGRHAPGATRIRTAAQAAHAGSIRGLGNANRSLTMGIGCWSPLRTSSTTRKRYAGSARRRWML